MHASKWGLLAVSLIIVAGWFYYTSGGKPVLRDHKKSKLTVSVAPFIRKEFTPNIEAIGTVKAFESVTISVNVTEFVEKIHFQDGQYVKKNTPLVTLGSAEEQAQLMRVQAQLAEAKAQFERTQQLIKKHYSARSEHDLREATMKAAQAQLEEIKAKLNDRIITAPFDGILGFRQVSEGALLEPGDAIVTLDMIKPLKVDFTLAERLLNKVKLGQTFSAESIAYTEQKFQGKISAIATRLDELSRSVKVRGIIPNENEHLKPGMLLKINIPSKPRLALEIPEQALLSHGNTRFVFAVTMGVVEKIPLSIIQRDRGNVIVEAKVPKGSLLVIDGGFKLKPGMKVETKNATL